MCLPGFPVHSTVAERGIFVTIDSIEVRFVTPVVPPGSVTNTGTAAVPQVIVILIAS